MWSAAAGMTLTMALPVIVLVVESVAVNVWLPVVFRITPAKVCDPGISSDEKYSLSVGPSPGRRCRTRFTLPSILVGTAADDVAEVSIAVTVTVPAVSARSGLAKLVVTAKPCGRRNHVHRRAAGDRAGVGGLHGDRRLPAVVSPRRGGGARSGVGVGEGVAGR